MRSKLIAFAVSALFLFSCNQTPNTEEPGEKVRNTEAREDSIKLANAYALMSLIENTVQPAVETDPVSEGKREDAADDPAVWINADNPDSSILFGTNKQAGIYAYDLQGNEVAYYAIGAVNNIDIRQNVKVGEEELDILSGSNRTDNSVIAYQISQNGELINLLPSNHQISTDDLDEVYGFCMYKDPDGVGYSIINGKNGKINMYQILGVKDSVFLELTDSWNVESQPEGMVADDEKQLLYIGEEEKGIWRISFTKDVEPVMLAQSMMKTNEYISYDIEGLAIYDQPVGTLPEGFLLASSQGSFSYAIFDRSSGDYVTSFKIGGSDSIDGVEETDGLEVISTALGSSFPNGILAVQDGFNFQGEELLSQNFKIIDLGAILLLLEN